VAEIRADSARLQRECEVWCRYLVDQAPAATLLARYRDAHAAGVVETAASNRAFDRALVRIARRGTFAARCCDAHARLFSPAGLLRRKLVLTLALLETDASHHERVDQLTPGSRLGWLVHCAALALGFALLVLGGLIVFLPLRLACALFCDSEGRA
jgi:hypothetical protein